MHGRGTGWFNRSETIIPVHAAFVQIDRAHGGCSRSVFVHLECFQDRAFRPQQALALSCEQQVTKSRTLLMHELVVRPTCGSALCRFALMFNDELYAVPSLQTKSTVSMATPRSLSASRFALHTCTPTFWTHPSRSRAVACTQSPRAPDAIQHAST